MSSKTADQDAPLESLRADYRRAFEEWALQVGHLQTISQSDPNGLVIEDAKERVAATEMAYRGTRNRLAEKYFHR